MNKMLLPIIPLLVLPLLLAGCGNSKTESVAGVPLPKTPATYKPVPEADRQAARKAKELPYAKAVAYNAAKH